MSFGEATQGSHGWTLNYEQSKKIIYQALDLGINFFDTANIYSLGSSEEIVGRVLQEAIPRSQAVIATKVYEKMNDKILGKKI